MEMRNGTICAQVLIFFTGHFQSHMDKMQPKKHQGKGELALDLQGLHDLRAVPSFWASISPSVQVGKTPGQWQYSHSPENEKGDHALVVCPVGRQRVRREEGVVGGKVAAVAAPKASATEEEY